MPNDKERKRNILPVAPLNKPPKGGVLSGVFSIMFWVQKRQDFKNEAPPWKPPSTGDVLCKSNIRILYKFTSLVVMCAVCGNTALKCWQMF